jgi:hypothetical protein
MGNFANSTKKQSREYTMKVTIKLNQPIVSDSEIYAFTAATNINENGKRAEVAIYKEVLSSGVTAYHYYYSQERNPFKKVYVGELQRDLIDNLLGW